MVHPLVEYFRCPEHLAVLGTADPLPTDEGYFRFGDAIAYGRQNVGAPSPRPDGSLVDVSCGVSSADGKVLLPFDLSEALANLRHERYPEAQRAIERISASSAPHAVYYFFRPFLPVGVRRHLQKLSLRGWSAIPFPRWPVDVTVETLMKRAAGLALERGGIAEFPFVWFWPDGACSGAMMTHDVEGAKGAALCGQLMDLDEQFGVRSSFQIIPSGPRASKFSSTQLVEQIHRRGFEVNVHDLTHDGRLFRDRELFPRRATEINAWGRVFGTRGFRSGAMYRRQDWFAALDFSYDMSVPNVAHLEPQQGGCCTVMPHFIGDVLELPLTTTQDYSLFHILSDYSIELWKEQIALILANHGLASFIAHPDYLLGKRERDVYVALLTHLTQLRAEEQVWVAPPSEIDRWWRNRQEMRLVPDGDSWRVAGPDGERARVAYARLRDGRVVYELARPGGGRGLLAPGERPDGTRVGGSLDEQAP